MNKPGFAQRQTGVPQCLLLATLVRAWPRGEGYEGDCKRLAVPPLLLFLDNARGRLFSRVWRAWRAPDAL